MSSFVVGHRDGSHCAPGRIPKLCCRGGGVMLHLLMTFSVTIAIFFSALQLLIGHKFGGWAPAANASLQAFYSQSCPPNHSQDADRSGRCICLPQVSPKDLHTAGHQHKRTVCPVAGVECGLGSSPSPGRAQSSHSSSEEGQVSSGPCVTPASPALPLQPSQGPQGMPLQARGFGTAFKKNTTPFPRITHFGCLGWVF